jgi:hypothetical protein
MITFRIYNDPTEQIILNPQEDLNNLVIQMNCSETIQSFFSRSDDNCKTVTFDLGEETLTAVVKEPMKRTVFCTEPQPFH